MIFIFLLSFIQSIYIIHAENFFEYKILPFPLGWESRTEYINTITDINFNIFNSVSLSDQETFLTAPFEGYFSQVDGSFVLEGKNYRIIYPCDLNLSSSELDRNVRIGEKIILLRSENRKMIVFFRKMNMAFRKISNGHFLLSANSGSPVVSILSGTFFREKHEMFNNFYEEVFVSGEMEITYLGLTDFPFETRQKVQEGENIGRTGGEEYRGSLTIYFDQMPFGSVNPLFIYIERK